MNIVVQDLFAKYPSVAALAAAEPEEIEAIVKPCGLGRSKARDISACMRVLRDKYNCMNIFVHADKEDRVKRVVEEYGVKGENVSAIVDKTDKQRARHYQYYSDQLWGAAENYHLTLNTSRFSIDQAVSILKNVAEMF